MTTITFTTWANILRTVESYTFSLALNNDRGVAKARRITLSSNRLRVLCSIDVWATNDFPISNRSKYARKQHHI